MPIGIRIVMREAPRGCHVSE